MEDYPEYEWIAKSIVATEAMTAYLDSKDLEMLELLNSRIASKYDYERPQVNRTQISVTLPSLQGPVTLVNYLYEN